MFASVCSHNISRAKLGANVRLFGNENCVKYGSVVDSDSNLQYNIVVHTHNALRFVGGFRLLRALRRKGGT